MRRFRFPLARLERVREHREKIARRYLAEQVAVVAALDERLATVESNLEVCQSEDRRAHSLGEAVQTGLRSVRRRLTIQRSAANGLAEQAREVYTERRRDLKALQRLHERRFEDWRTEMAREEQAELDEVARLRFAANKQSSEHGESAL